MKLLIVGLLITSLAGADTLSHQCGKLRLGFDSSTGHWTELSVEEGPNLLGGEGVSQATLQLEGAQWPEATAWKAGQVTSDQTAQGPAIRVTRTAGDWRVIETYTLRDTLIRRSARFTYSGQAPVKLVGCRLRVPGVTLGDSDDAVWSLPGNFPVAEQPLSENAPGRSTRERGWTWSETGLAYARSDGARTGILANYSLVLDSARPFVEEAAGAVSLAHRFSAVAVLKPGDEIQVGDQLVRVATGAQADMEQAARELARAANPGPPEDRPAWLAGAVIHEMHPWGRLEAWHGGDRGNRMPNIEAQLPYLQSLGTTGIWILPVSNKPPWVYQLPGFRHMDPAVTTPEQLRSFIATAHGLDMRVLMDLVTYGVSPASKDVASLPGHVWCIDEKGERAKAWGDSVLAADCSDPDWRAHIKDLTSWWVKEFGADGFRLDCGGCGQVLNWRPRTGVRANAGMLAGGVGQNEIIRTAIRRINPDAVLLPEAGAPSHLRAGDLIFDYPLYMVCRTVTRMPDRAAWVRELRRFLHTQQFTHAPEAISALVRFTENHDLVTAQQFFGAGPSQAMTALNAFIPGVLLLHQEQEIGLAPELRQWLRLRHNLPQLKQGKADYLAVTCDDPNVLTFLRYTEDSAAIIAINMGDAATECTLSVPAEITRQYPGAVDALEHRAVDLAAKQQIAPYRPKIICLTARGPERPDDARPKAPPGDSSLVVETRREGVADARVRYTIRLASMHRWFVKTTEGFFMDEFVDRSRQVKQGETHVSATLPLLRCWRPVENRLWDGPGDKGFGFIASDGRTVTIDVTDMKRIIDARIEEPSAVGKQASVFIEATSGPEPFRVAVLPDEADIRRPQGYEHRLAGGLITLNPLWVRVDNEHYTMALARRHGGAISDLRRAATGQSLLAGHSEVYTDWGLYERGKHIATEWETNPSLQIEDQGDSASITFRGHLRWPSWNGVQTGHVANAPVAYRITYDVDASPTVKITFGITPLTDRPKTNAFLAYRIPFAGITTWTVTGDGDTLDGRTGDKPGQRVYQANEAEDMSKVSMALGLGAGSLVIQSFSGDHAMPDNPFLLDGGPGTLHLFAALLNGVERDLPAGVERAASFEMTVQ